MEYPKPHFTGTPQWVKEVITQAIQRAGMLVEKWQVPLEAIARYETDCNPSPSELGTDARGMMQCSVGMYKAAKDAGFIQKVNFHDPEQAVVVAIHYINSELTGYGGYHGINKLLLRDDRGPGDVLRAWIEHPRWEYPKLRPYYHGY